MDTTHSTTTPASDNPSAPSISDLYPSLEPSPESLAASSNIRLHTPATDVQLGLQPTSSSSAATPAALANGGLGSLLDWFRRTTQSSGSSSASTVEVAGAGVLEGELNRLLEEVQKAVTRRPELANAVNGVVDQTAINLRYTIDLALSQIDSIVKSPDAASGRPADLPPSYTELHPQIAEPTLQNPSASSTSPPRSRSPRPSMGLAEAITHILGVGPVFRPAGALPSTTQQPQLSTTARSQQSLLPTPAQVPAAPSSSSQTPLPVTPSLIQPTSASRPSLSTALGSSLGVNPRETIDRLSQVLGAVMGAMALVRPQQGASTEHTQGAGQPPGKDQKVPEKH